MNINLDLGPDAQGNATLSTLRGAKASGPLASGAPLVPGLWFDLDPDAAADGEIDSPAGQLLSARLRLRRPARWLALHLALGPVDLGPAEVAGFALRGEAPGPVPLRACLRSGRHEGEGFTERFFPKQILLAPGGAVHLDAMLLGGARPLPATAPWRDFILFLDPPASCTFTIHDLRLFIV